MAVERDVGRGIDEGHVSVNEAVASIGPRGRVFIAQTHVDGEIGPHLPAIVDVIGLAGGPELGDRQTSRVFILASVAQHEIGESVAGGLTLNDERAAYELV